MGTILMECSSNNLTGHNLISDIQNGINDSFEVMWFSHQA